MAPSQDKIKSTLIDYNPISSAHNVIKSSMSVVILAQPQPSSEDAIQDSRQDLPPEVLYSHEALSGPHTIHRILRDYLVSMGFQYRQHPKSNRVVYGLPATLYDQRQDQESALANIESLHHRPPSQNS